MGDFIETLGNNITSLNSDLNVRLCLVDSNQFDYETGLQHVVNQEVQFYTEKAQSNIYNVYGSINPSLNLRLMDGTKPNIDFFKFNQDNWQVVLMKPTMFKGAKGKTNFLKSNIHEYDFNYGLPCLKVIPKQEELKSYMSFNCYFGHNFKQDDRVYITSLDPLYIESGYFNIIGVDGNTISINNEYIEVIPDYTDNDFTTNNTIDEQVAQIADDLATSKLATAILTAPVFKGSIELTNYITSIKKKGFFRRRRTVVTGVTTKYTAAVDINVAVPKATEIANNDELLHLKNIEIGILNKSILDEIKKKRPNISKIIQPKYFIKKVLEDYQLEYYMKQAEVIAVANEFNVCAFSLSSTSEQVINYTFPDINVSGMVDNHGIPLTELIIAVVKKSGNKNIDISDVESNLSKLINYTEVGHGIDTIMLKNDSSEVDQLKVGDSMFIGVCEYDKELLNEAVVINLHQRVIHRDVSFTYNPFYKVKLKVFSSYVEDSESKIEIPDYAVYSDLQQKYIWRDIHDIGFFETNGIGVDYKFLNGSFYIYERINFILNNSFTAKYVYNQNDLNRVNDLNSDISSVKDILSDLVSDPNTINTSNQGYEEFKFKKC